MVASSYTDYLKEDLTREADRRGLLYPSNATKEDLAALLEESDGDNAEGPILYSFAEYDPTPEEREQDLLMGFNIAAGAVRAAKVIGGNNPQYDPAIEELEARVEELRTSIGE